MFKLGHEPWWETIASFTTIVYMHSILFVMLIETGSKEMQMPLYVHRCFSDVYFMDIISVLLLNTSVLLKNYCHLINQHIYKTGPDIQFSLYNILSDGSVV